MYIEGQRNHNHMNQSSLCAFHIHFLCSFAIFRDFSCHHLCKVRECCQRPVPHNWYLSTMSMRLVIHIQGESILDSQPPYLTYHKHAHTVGGGIRRKRVVMQEIAQLGMHDPVGWLGGIGGQVAVSALGSSCACPTAFITFCPSWCLQRIQSHRHVQRAPSPNGWGCDLQDSIELGVHPGQWSLLHQVLVLAGSHLALPGSGWLSVLRLKTPVGTGCRLGSVRGQCNTYNIQQGMGLASAHGA